MSLIVSWATISLLYCVRCTIKSKYNIQIVFFYSSLIQINNKLLLEYTAYRTAFSERHTGYC